jgi:tetratricopeptide (TPR) repeat protein
LALGKVDAARAHLQLACDDDAVPVRTDSHINALIRQTVQAFASRENLVLLDTPSLLGANLGGICGNELFYEHVHFNPHGSYQLGLAWAAQVDSFLPPTLKSRLAGPWASPELCEHRLALTDWNRRNDLNEIVNRRHAAPLNGQSNNAAQLVELQNQLAEVSQRMDAAGVAQARQICVDALQRAPQDLDLHCNYADFLEAIGGIREAADQWQQVQRLRPDYYLGYFQAGRMQERLGQLDSARAAFQQSVAVHPFMAPAWFELSNIAASQGNLGLALQNVRRATQLQPHRPVYYACQGKLLGRMNRHADAIEQYRLALRVDPSYWDGHMALGGEWVDQENWAAAQTEFEAATQLRPDSIPAHLALGGVFARRGQVDAARREAAQVLQRDPGNPQAQSLLSQLPPE